MDANAIVGVILLIGSTAAIAILTLWSRKRIDRIAQKKSSSARQIIQEMKNGE